ncbi:HlyD family efflux transporter periplasmic adaptor subunit [Panacibacter ginsenosidivorans]|uniref:HlyD family efflux transporter periplasmic adaptor subunit n=1 Tax=Panacibacter ginsenosidivorans TaxID=1813871 RepID=A0A5B8VAZ4_9BACT|nr:efflux RND transporter periplasmic adaptor subunit [Panacibacter ginsenosidivorans]QEC68640.1 HlyD family efflux transporter periplasmic adaptor subunit [Panacibacter ginsenosidivorans]
MSKKLKWIIIILVVLVVALIGLSKAGVIGGNDEGIKVATEKAAIRNITEIVTASGKVFPEVEVKVSPDISGEIVALNVAEGDTVRKGQVLANIYGDIYASQRDQAAAVVSQSEAQAANSSAQLGALKATLDQTEASYKRQKTLLDQKVISASEFEQAQQAWLSAKANYDAATQSVKANKAGVQSAMASLTRAQKDVSRATITAPMDGVVSLLSVKKGERVAGNSFNVGTEMMRIADLSSIEVQVDVGENDIPKVKLGDTALIEIDAFNNRKFKGIVFKIANPVTNALTSTSSSTQVTNYQVHIRLQPDSYKDLIVKGQPFPFRPNMSASADIQTKTNKNVLTVPLNAVTTRDKNEGKNLDAADKNKDENKTESASADDDITEVVFVVQKDGIVRKRPVKTDIQDINYIQVLEGLKAGEEIVTAPYDVVSKQLKDSSKVKVVTKEELLKNFTAPK